MVGKVHKVVWYLRLFGEMSAEREGVTLRRFRAKKYGALLAFLALPPCRMHTRDELVDLFWPDTDIAAGRTCLRTALASLRRQLVPPCGESALIPADLFHEGTRNTLQINPEIVTTDVARYEALVRRADLSEDPCEAARLLREAADLYAGPLLPDVWDTWAMIERERLEAVQERVCQRRAELEALVPASPFLSSLDIKRGRSLPSPVRAEEHKMAGPTVLRLPLTPTRFWGRSGEMGQLDSWLDVVGEQTPRLITITGAAGMGKTRLAVAVAHRMAGRFAGAVCFVPLAACTEAERMPDAIADALHIERGPNGDPHERIAALLEEIGPSLLILDNLEQIAADGAAQVVRRLLARSPDLRILATSRQPLRIDGEQEMPLSGLDAADALSLFTDRARASRPDFAVTPRNEETLSSLCGRLDGMPLAIELCAAWSHLLTPSQMLDRLTRRFELLISRRRDVIPRHRSLHAALEWGCPTEPELRRFFAALSVFRGGWTLEAAEAVTGAPNVLDLLAALREHSLVVAEADETMRYRFLETIREFANDLMTPEERASVRHRHFEYFAAFAEHVTGPVHHTDSQTAFLLLEAEDANIRAALDHGFDGEPEELKRSLELTNSLGWHWWVRGRGSTETLGWLQRAADRLDECEGELRADVLRVIAYLARRRGDYMTAERYYLEAIIVYQALGSVLGEAAALERLAELHSEQEEFDASICLREQAAALRQAAGDEHGAILALSSLAGLYYHRLNDPATARPLLDRCLTHAHKTGDRGGAAKIGISLSGIACQDGRLDEAERLARDAVIVFRSRGETWNLASALGALAEVFSARGQKAEKERTLAECVALYEQIGDPGTAALLRTRLA
jgi:predicted ATPase